jgi:hypothetical protein
VGRLGSVIVRSIGRAALGAVLVVGGAESVRLPRLPEDVLPPGRASANTGLNARAATAATARKRAIRDMV